MASGPITAPKRLSPQSLLLAHDVNGDSETVSTYSGRKISDYDLILFLLRYTSTDSLIRDTAIVYTDVFGSVILSAHHGTGLSSLSAITVNKASNTSFTLTKSGEKGLHSIEILGIKLV